MKKNIKCLVFIINWQQFEETKSLLISSDFNPEYFDVYIFDNEACNESRELFKTLNEKYKYYEYNKENLGFAPACNMGLNFANENNYEYVLFLNNDAAVSGHDVEVLFESVKNHKKVALASPLIMDSAEGVVTFSGAKLNEDKNIIIHTMPDEIPDNMNEHRFLLYGTALLGRVAPLIEVGGFFEPFFAYWEDFLLCTRLMDKGYACAMVKDAKVFHQNDRSNEEQTVRSKYYYYYLTRNEIIFWKNVSASYVKQVYWLFSKSFNSCILLLKKGNYEQAKAIALGFLDGLLNNMGRWKQHPKKI